MKNYMKKIIIGIFGLAFILTANSAFAAVSWNGASNDCSTVSIANHDTGEGHGDPCWPGTTISANDEDSVNVRIYYHNTGDQNATNTRIKLTAPTSSSSTHSFTGQIISDQGSSNSSTVRVNTPAGSTLTFSSAKWLPNRSQNPASLLNRQNGSAVLSGGLNIGTITPSWDSQGSVVVTFKVSSPQIPPANTPTGTLTPANNSCTISLGQNSCQINFTWNTVNPVGTSAITRDGGSNVATGNSGSKAFTIPYNTATFRLYNNALGLDTATVSSSCTSGTYWNGNKCAENVNPTYNCAISSFTVGGALSTNISSGSSVELAWSTTNCNYVNIPGVGSNLSPTGSSSVSPTTNTTYQLTGYGSTGTNPTRSVSVAVTPNTNPSYSCMITDFKANGELFNTIGSGDQVNLSWSTQNCYTVSITPNVGTGLNPNDSHTVNPTTTTTYTLTAKGNTGSSVSRTVKVTVTPKVEERYYCSITGFTTDDNYVTYGDEARLSWDTENCYSVSISNIGNVALSGNKYTTLTRPTTYVLTALGTNGIRQTRSLYINVGPANHNNDYDYCSISNFSANQTYINAGSPVALSWSTNNCTSVNISNVGSVSNYGSRTVYPGGTTNYTLTAYGRNGESIIRSISVVVNSIIIPVIPPVYNSCAITTVATNITGNSATLNGMVSSGSYGNSYFEYGTSVGLGQRTSSRFISSSSFSETISGLSPNSIYYFRFVSVCQGSTGYGSIDVFRTLGSSVVRPIVIQGTTVIGQTSPVMLKIENRYEAISKGDTIEYTVTYKNIGKSILRNPILQVIVPGSVTVRNTSRGTYQEDTRTLTVELDDLYPNEEGVLYIQGHVVSNVEDTAKIVSTALLVYTNTNSAQENAIAYVLNVPKQFFSSSNNLGASAFFGGLFGGVCGGFGLIGWLLLIIIILLIILLIRKYFYLPRTNYNNGVYPPNTH
jgi:uncharacterized repeat protein (TIGR01451 family)